jgi:hypothetical protein
MIGGAAAQETWAAVGSFLNDGAAWSDWRCALRIGGTKNCHDGQADSGSYVHGARIVANEEVALRKQRRKIGNGSLSGEINGRAAHAGSDGRRNRNFGGCAEQDDVGIGLTD